MDLSKIRNFSIIAHIDHGKSTLADRMLEVTHTIEARKMREQVLDTMELEKERGITIKMTPVSMDYKMNGADFKLNLIDTPGHIDFSYEVSRAIKAVEGSVLLVDSTQGVQAQTLSVLAMAREAGLVIIPAVSKIDSPLARVKEVKEEVAKVLHCDVEDVMEVSGKTGEGVEELLKKIIEKVPAPVDTYHAPGEMRALVFDFKYSDHKGVIVYVRMLDGVAVKGEKLQFCASQKVFGSLEVGVFSPEETPVAELKAGSIGYIVTGVKEPGIASVGDTLTFAKNPLPAFPGYMAPKPVVWASVYPEDADDFTMLRQSLGRLRLSDSSLSYEEETSGALGRGFRCGFLGMLHLEIITERLRREFSLELVVTTPSIVYEIKKRNGKSETIYSPHLFPPDGEILEVDEPWMRATIILPNERISQVMPLLYAHEGEVLTTETFGEGRSDVIFSIPLREMMRNFFDELKSATSGYASISYEPEGMRKADVTRLDILMADEIVPAFTRVVSKRRAAEEGEEAVEKLHTIMPRQMFETKIQAFALGRILASKTIKAFRKDVTGYLYGGDITRKMKLLEKQKKGKKKMKERGKINIPHEVFLKMMRGGKDQS